MNMVKTWGQSFPILAAVAVATTGMGLFPAIAAPPAPQPVAQTSLIGQCRAVNKSTPIYEAAAATSRVVKTLSANTQVTLANEGSQGFIAVSAPVQGFVQAVNLKPCPATQPTGGTTTGGTTTGGTTTGSGTSTSKDTCRQVYQPLGLVIRKEAGTAAAVVGQVAQKDRVELTTNPATIKMADDGRVWVQIAKPAAGWISNGFKTGPSNLVLCP